MAVYIYIYIISYYYSSAYLAAYFSASITTIWPSQCTIGHGRDRARDRCFGLRSGRSVRRPAPMRPSRWPRWSPRNIGYPRRWKKNPQHVTWRMNCSLNSTAMRSNAPSPWTINMIHCQFNSNSVSIGSNASPAMWKNTLFGVNPPFLEMAVLIGAKGSLKWTHFKPDEE